MADLKRLLALRSGSRVIAARLIEKLKNVFVDENMEPSREIHELESKLTELKTWYDTLEDFDQQILLVTEKEELQKEIKKTYHQSRRWGSLSLPNQRNGVVQIQTLFQLHNQHPFCLLEQPVDQKSLCHVSMVMSSIGNFFGKLSLLKFRVMTR
ncbi:hypothetical protein OUZ56_003737 [Daphnia magna]|uniref:Uncharacterized protein n=1 Tax=Daphnia magna TaxID=35525 RepID=A0ABR0A9K8_9CRUS|nr:hypothetical protein OUZ56_003737 [Daphnia magna]